MSASVVSYKAVKRASGLQKEVLALYRRSLRLIRQKPVSTQPKFSLLIRYNFRHNASSVKPNEIDAIEHLLRKGRRQIEQLEHPNVKDCWVGSDMLQWSSSHPHRRLQ